MKIRTFLALEFPKIFRNKLLDYVEMVSGHYKLQEIHWHHIQNYHLTLTFLGNIKYLLISNLHQKLVQSLKSTNTVSFRFSEITSFPFSRTSKIIAVMLEHLQELMGFNKI